MARILVTGSKGVVGTYLVGLLPELGHSVMGIDLEHAPGELGWEQVMSKHGGEYCRCDIGEFREVERVFERFGPFDFVYNCAAEFGRWNGEDFYERVWKSNAIGTKNVIRLQEKRRFKMIHFSSSEVYGDYDEVMTEDVMNTTPIRQMNDYAMSKWVNETQIRNSRIMHGTETVIVRLFNTYGPGEWYHPYRSVNCRFVYHALKGLPVTVYREHFRTSTYLTDTARALCNISENFKDGEVYNIGGSEYHDIETLADIIWSYTGADRKLITTKDSEVLTTKVKKVDNSKSVRDLGYKSTVGLKEGLHKTVDWMKATYGQRA